MLSNKDLSAFQQDVDPEENEKALQALGGLHGLEVGLQTSFTSGLKGDEADLRARHEKYGKNEVRKRDYIRYVLHHTLLSSAM